ncbi:zinc-binding dehydrogenase [Candidatus Poribacteria bacterium]|nr:zinc-binding dehydrogenase [Candidatus Poribacteria bacterium]
MQKSTLVAQFHGHGKPFEICEQTIATPDPGSVLVKISLATICGSDLHTVSGRRSAPTPCILGHEIVGEVAAPTAVRDAYGQALHEGDRVTWSIMAWCGKCQFCTDRNLPQKCERLFKYGHARNGLSGGFAEYIHLQPGTSIYRVPDCVTDAEAVPLNCAFATILSGLEVIDVSAEKFAVVQGAGMLGIYAACYLREQGYQIVAVVDPVAERLQIAERFGATHTFNLSEMPANLVGQALQDLTNGHGMDLAVEVSGASAAFTNSLDWLGVGGSCLTLGFVYPHADVTVDAHKIVTKCLTIRGNHNYHPSALGTAIKFVEEKRERYPFKELIGAVYPLKEINAAFDRAMQGDLIRVAINP